MQPQQKLSKSTSILNLAWSNTDRHKKSNKSYLKSNDVILVDGFDTTKEEVVKYKN